MSANPLIISEALLARFSPYLPDPPTTAHSPAGMMLRTSLRKSVIRTPHQNGKVAYDAVPKGASIWVTVTDPASPLHGRPILITKRPDGKFAMTGGSGWEHYKPGDNSAGNKDLERQRARKHQVLEGVGEKPKTDADRAASAELSEKRKALHQASTERRQKRDTAARGLLQAAGYDPDSFKNDRELDKWRDRTEADAVAAGMSKGDARRFVGLAVAEVQKLKRKLAMQKAEVSAVASAHAVKNGRDAIDSRHLALIEALPDPDALDDRPLISGVELAQLAGDKTPQEVEAAIRDRAGDMWQQVNDQARADAGSAAAENSTQIPSDYPDPLHNDQEGQRQPFSGTEGADLSNYTADNPGASGEVEPNSAPEGQPDGSSAAAIPHPRPGMDAPDLDAEADEDDQDDQDEEANDETDMGPEPEPEPVNDEERAARVEKIKALAGAFADYHEAHADTRAKSEEAAELRSKLLMGASVVENLRTRIGAISDADMERLIDKYSSPHTAHAPDAFYSALAPHWNDSVSYADGIGQYAAAGAAAALTGLAGKFTGAGMDVARLINSSSIETATMGLAMRLREDMSDSDFDQLIGDVTRHNASNQQATEDRALGLQKKLERERGEIIRQRAMGELDSDPNEAGVDPLERMRSADLQPHQVEKLATSLRLEADNLLRQRENMGTALGSMQASAGLLEALTRAKAAKRKNQVVSLSFGDNLDAAHEQITALGLAGRARIRHDISKGYVVDIPSQALKRHMGQVQQHAEFAGAMEKIKTDPSPTDGYQVPGWKSGTGYKWRTEQRNDIEWLRQTGGGVITRVTGAGKTNTALGFAAHQLAANPTYTAAIVVPKGKASEWHGEAQKFSTLPTVAIPDDAKRADVARMISEGGRGKLYIMSHDQAARHSDLLEGAELDGVTIDEPHMLTSAKSKSQKVNAGAQRVMKLGQDKLKAGGTFHRVALTATPAKTDPVNAYDLVNWVAPGKIGSRERFRRAYAGGFGAGTNAQEEAVQEQVIKHLGPYMSGERMTPPTFKTIRHDTSVTRSPEQIAKQKEIERGAKQYIEARVADRLRRAESDGMIQAKYGRAWRAGVAREETVKAQQAIGDQHRANLGGGANNAKIAAAIATVRDHGADASNKHVFYVDSAEQRQALTEALKGAGYKANQVANMASTTTQISGDELSARRQRFKSSDDVPFVIIDKSSAAGHNLQEGSHLHVLGTPADAATYLQAQGRIAREPRVGDVHIHGYRYSDSPFESRDWADLDRQLKILKATAPGLVSGG